MNGRGRGQARVKGAAPKVRGSPCQLLRFRNCSQVNACGSIFRQRGCGCAGSFTTHYDLIAHRLDILNSPAQIWDGRANPFKYTSASWSRLSHSSFVCNDL